MKVLIFFKRHCSHGMLVAVMLLGSNECKFINLMMAMGLLCNTYKTFGSFSIFFCVEKCLVKKKIITVFTYIHLVSVNVDANAIVCVVNEKWSCVKKKKKILTR